LESDAVPLDVQLPGRRADLVFAYLTVEHEREVSRYELADALWPDGLPDTWAAALRSVVSEVRRFLDAGGLDGQAMVAATGPGWQLRVPPDVGIDIDEARGRLGDARERLDDEPSEAAADADRAAAATSLPFLPGHDCEWADTVRGDLRGMNRAALEVAAEGHERSGESRAAVTAAERLVRADPYDEASHRLLINVLGRHGDRAGARRAYKACVDVLARELGVEPSPATQASLTQALTVELAEVEPTDAPTSESKTDFATRSVLVVEDHDFQRHAAVTLMRRIGVESVSAASGGEAALEMLARMPRPDIVVCDLDMPGMDGIELIRLIAAGNLANAVAIMSALDRGIVETVRAIGEGYGLQVLGVIEKPLTAATLGDALRAYRPPAAEVEAVQIATVDELMMGLDDGRTSVDLSPIVELATGRITAVEALPRFDTHGEGRVPVAPAAVPDDMALAERLHDGLVDLACAAAHDLADAGHPLQIVMRLPHARLPEVHYQGLPARLDEIARKRKVAPSGLALTVGEAFASGSTSMPLEAIARLRVKGFGVWLDDAGPNARLDRVPITGIRLSAALVADAESNPHDRGRIRALAERARDLRLQTLGTGCTDSRRVEILIEAGVGLAQGPMIATPMPIAALTQWIASWDPVSLVADHD
jgi:DNA-binding SARP family transcriptional activator/EAL domain-containing protein (putative c-di-GMP-specific phosphodiesterase class I)